MEVDGLVEMKAQGGQMMSWMCKVSEGARWASDGVLVNEGAMWMVYGIGWSVKVKGARWASGKLDVQGR